jgi:hypothetical protein
MPIMATAERRTISVTIIDARSSTTLLNATRRLVPERRIMKTRTTSPPTVDGRTWLNSILIQNNWLSGQIRPPAFVANRTSCQRTPPRNGMINICSRPSARRAQSIAASVPRNAARSTWPSTKSSMAPVSISFATNTASDFRRVAHAAAVMRSLRTSLKLDKVPPPNSAY